MVWKRISANEALLGKRWDAASHVFTPHERGSWVPLRDLVGRFQEGSRLDASDSRELGLFHPSSITGLRLEEQGLPTYQPPQKIAKQLSPIGSGDVVLSKFLPIRAAWVTPATSRRPVDQNCIRLIGMKEVNGFWIANVLEHPVFQCLLAHRSASSVLPRLGIRDLKQLRVPSVPVEVEELSVRWSIAVEQMTAATTALTALQAEAECYAQGEAPPFATKQAGFCSAADFPSIWTPGYACLKQCQALARQRGWVSIEAYVSDESQRLREGITAPVRLLRFRDADGAFSFRMPSLEVPRQAVFRIFASSLEEDEVLLSGLASSPKVVFHCAASPEPIFLSDQWLRLRPLLAPGALALLLRTSPVASQMSLATIGSTQQFVPKSELSQLHIPVLPEALAHRWDQALRTSIKALENAKESLDEIQAEAWALVGRCIEESNDT